MSIITGIYSTLLPVFKVFDLRHSISKGRGNNRKGLKASNEIDEEIQKQFLEK